jgi:hypothetical protein
MAKPPPDFINGCLTRLNEVRAEALNQNVKDLAESMLLEIVLCGRIWSNTDGFKNASLTNHSGALQSHLRACLAFNLLERLENYDWQNMELFLRNETISNTRYPQNRSDSIREQLLELGITEDEKETLENLRINIDDVNSDGVKLELPAEESWETRDLFHVSLDGIQKVISKNIRKSKLPEADARSYFSLTISNIFDKAVLSMVKDPGALRVGKEGVGLLHRVEEHALISVPKEDEPRNEMILELLSERLSRKAQGRGMNLDGLRLTCSKATEKYDQAEDIPTKTLAVEKHKIDPQILEHSMKVLHAEEQQINSGWGGLDSKERGKKAIYIDAVQLSTQIWGELGDRTSIKAFLRSIRITPYLNFVFGRAIGSVSNSRKILHGGDDFLLTYDKHVLGKKDLVPELMVSELERLIGVGRWHVKKKKTEDGETEETWHVIGTGFARPFWWWYDGEAFGQNRDGEFIKALMAAKGERRHWLREASRTDIQIHPNMD